MALPTNLEEDQKLAGVLKSFNLPYIFIGANDQVTEGLFVDVKGQPVNYLNWGSGEPGNHGGDEDCTVINTNGRWCDASCETPFLFACEIE